MSAEYDRIFEGSGFATDSFSEKSIRLGMQLYRLENNHIIVIQWHTSYGKTNISPIIQAFSINLTFRRIPVSVAFRLPEQSLVTICLLILILILILPLVLIIFLV